MSGANDAVGSLLLCFAALFFPPAVPLMLYGCGGSFFINFLLTILGWLPGVIHAFVLVFNHTSGKDERKRIKKLQKEQQKHYQDPAFVAVPNGQQGYQSSAQHVAQPKY